MLPTLTSILVSAAVAVTIMPVGASAAESPAPDDGQVHIGTAISSRKLSNEISVSRFAFARRAALIRSGPHRESRVTGRLDKRTGEGEPLPYLALGDLSRRPGATWIKIRIPSRPNGQTGWVKRTALRPFQIAYGRLVVNRADLRATLYSRHGQVKWRAPIGIGKRGFRTPAGRFWVTERLEAFGGSAFGPFAFGTSAHAPHPTGWPGGEGVVGIHGTDKPGSVPGRSSHGGIRVRNPDLRILARILKVGTPVRIR